jgi:hypothetical protein
VEVHETLFVVDSTLITSAPQSARTAPQDGANSQAATSTTFTPSSRSYLACSPVTAVGLCDEHDLTIITLTIQARLRLPYDLGRSMSELAATAQRVGFDSLFTPADTVLPG